MDKNIDLVKIKQKDGCQIGNLEMIRGRDQ